MSGSSWPAVRSSPRRSPTNPPTSWAWPRQDRQGGDQVQRRDDRDGLTLSRDAARPAFPAPRLGGPRAGRARACRAPAGRCRPGARHPETARYPGVSRRPPGGDPALHPCPRALLGWPRAIRPAEKPYLLPQAADLPEVGRLTGRGNTANLESVLALKPDLILDVGSTAETYRSLADRVQGQTGIPYALLDGRLAAAPATYRSLGRLIGRDAEPFAALSQSILATMRERVARCRRRSAPGSTSPGPPRPRDRAGGLDQRRGAGADGRRQRRRPGRRPGAGLARGRGRLGARHRHRPRSRLRPPPRARTRSGRRPRPCGRTACMSARRCPSAGSISRPRSTGWSACGGSARSCNPRVFPEDIRGIARDLYGRLYHVTPDDPALDRVLAGAS